MRVYHLSHTDLDGYSSQLVTKKYFKNIEFFNSNYGREIDVKFNQILFLIESRLYENKSEKSLVLITDLNLTPYQCETFETKLNGLNSKILLLDHHQSGLECANKFPWYFLDSSRCATLITYEFFSDIYYKDEELKEFVQIVNSVDIWLNQESCFEFGKVCLGLVSGAKEINSIMFTDESREYIFYLLEKTYKYMGKQSAHIKLDEDIHGIKKSFFVESKDDTLSNLISKYVVKKLSLNRSKFEINYEDKKGILTYNIGNTSVIGNDFLIANPDIDFFLDVTGRKTMSFRANGNVDVSKISKHLVGGGGHVNASGGFYAGFKDGYLYEDIKLQIENLIKVKTES
ncbi:MAG: 3'-to-5' oligoribonuclease B [Campylobacter sp.]|nr:3'-to-5' oligoribonuclease B [Campylobacter sp.]